MGLVVRICSEHGRMSLARWGRCCVEDERPDAPPIPSEEEILAHVRRVHGVSMGGGAGLGIALGVVLALAAGLAFGLWRLSS